MHDDLTAWIMNGPVPFRIRGSDIQTAEFSLAPGDRITLQPHCFLLGAGGVRDINVNFGTRLRDPILRIWSGESGVLQEIVCEGEPGVVVLGAPQLGRIIRLPIRDGRSLICQRGAFIASTGQIDISVAITGRVRAGLFGGSGAVFQRLTGHGDVFLHSRGSVIDWRIPESRVVRVSTHNILAFEDTIGYDVQLSGSMFSLMFNKQGLFLSQLEGPGRILVQSMSIEAPMGDHPKHGHWVASTDSDALGDPNGA
jgi:uncharacterized protein (AIM24 family)